MPHKGLSYFFLGLGGLLSLPPPLFSPGFLEGHPAPLGLLEGLSKFYKSAYFLGLVSQADDVGYLVQDFRHKFTLLFATEIGEVECVKKLIAKGANKEHKNSDGYNAYAIAEHFHHIELMSLLR